MTRQLFVNLPIADVKRTRAFYAALGFGFNEQFSDANALCLVISEGSNYAMLLQRDYFQTFTHKQVANTQTTAQALVCISCESRAEVEALVAKAVAAGGSAPRPLKDHGFMVQHGFEDPDGNTWELIHMPDAAQ